MALSLGRTAYPYRSGTIVPNVMPEIILIDDNIIDANYLALLQELNVSDTDQEKVTWQQDTFSPITDTTSAAVASTTTVTIPVSNPDYFLVGELWQNQRTDEVIQVDSVNLGTGNIVVKRGVTALNSSGGTAAANMSSGDQLNKISSLVGENSSRQITRVTTPSDNYNYCQQFRKDLSMSRRDIKREHLNDNEMPYQQRKMIKEFRMDLDRNFLFSERARYTDPDTNDDVTINGGIRSFISTNILDVGGTLFKSAFDEFLMDYGFRYGSSNKILLASTQVILAFTNMVDSIAEFPISIQGANNVTIGTTAMRYRAPNGRNLLIVEDRNVSEQRPGEAYGIDMNEMTMKEFTNNGYSGSMTYIPDTQDPDDIGWCGTVIGDMCVTYGYETAHFTMKNVDGGSWGVSIV